MAGRRNAGTSIAPGSPERSPHSLCSGSSRRRPRAQLSTSRASVPGRFPNYDASTGQIAPTAAQLQAVDALGATATWNDFGTPHVLTKDGAFLASGVQGSTAVAAARNYLDANRALFKLASADALVLHGDSLLAGSQGHAVTFRQRFGSLDAWPNGIVTVGLTGSPAAGWKVASVASTLTGADSLTGTPQLSLQQGWSAAATKVGLSISVAADQRQPGRPRRLRHVQRRQLRRAAVRAAARVRDALGRRPRRSRRSCSAARSRRRARPRRPARTASSSTRATARC